MTSHAEYCICGGEMQITGSPSFVDGVVAIWRNHHSGKGHGPTTPKVARQKSGNDYRDTIIITADGNHMEE